MWCGVKNSTDNDDNDGDYVNDDGDSYGNTDPSQKDAMGCRIYRVSKKSSCIWRAME